MKTLDLTREIKEFGKNSEIIFSKIIDNEDEIKKNIIIPFIQLLGYDLLNDYEVRPDFIADRHNNRQKVNFAIHVKNKLILIHYTSIKEMESRTYYLKSCFQTSKATFGILTDGIQYKFFMKGDGHRTMDPEPFMQFNIRDVDVQFIGIINRLHKSSFNADAIYSLVLEYKYSMSLKKLVSNELKHPSTELIRFFAIQVYPQNDIKKYMPLFTEVVRSYFRSPLEKRSKKEKDDINVKDKKRTYSKMDYDSVIKKYKAKNSLSNTDEFFGKNIENPYNSYGLYNTEKSKKDKTVTNATN